MGIAPVESALRISGTTFGTGVGSGRNVSNPLSGSAPQPNHPVLGSSQKQEENVAKKIAQTYEPPQDVVEVHQDSEVKSQIVIEYLDKTKNVILQVPSTQELDFERAIAKEFQQKEKLRASAEKSAASTGVNANGN